MNRCLKYGEKKKYEIFFTMNERLYLLVIKLLLSLMNALVSFILQYTNSLSPNLCKLYMK